MNDSPGRRRNTFSSHRITALKRQLYSRVILIGRWIRYRAVNFLSVAAQSGSQQAIEALAGAQSKSNNVQIDQAAHIYIKTILQHRFRFDIQVNEVPGIRTGEFDIIID